MRLTDSGATADDEVNSKGAQFISVESHSDTFHFIVPGLNLTLLGVPPNQIQHPGTGVEIEAAWFSDPLLYAMGGFWFYASDPFTVISHYVTGFQTPLAATPTTGTAVFVGDVMGFVYLRDAAYQLAGEGLISVDFSSGTLGGSLETAYYNGEEFVPWNDVKLSANLTTGTNSFAGTAAVASTSDDPNMLKSNGTGRVDGNFYGPQGTELGAVWTLFDGDAAAAGSVVATRTPPEIVAAQRASKGENLPPAVFATPSGPKFDDPNNLPEGLFPLTRAVLRRSPNRIGPDPVMNAAHGLVWLRNTPTLPTAQVRVDLRLEGTGFDNQFASTSVVGNLVKPTMTGVRGDSDFVLETYGMSYASLGNWSKSDGGVFETTFFIGAHLFGLETPVSAMPKTGTATYSGVGMVKGSVVTSYTSHMYFGSVSGDATLSANFATGFVTGNFSNMKVEDGAAWNNVEVSAVIAGGTNTFSGGTTAISGSPDFFGMAQGATGFIDGGFFGPAAENLGAVWTLSDGASAAIGTVGAVRQ